MALAVKLFDFLYRAPQIFASAQQVRHRFVDWRMLKDYRKRQDVKKYGKERLRLNSLRKNKILPLEFQKIVDKELAMLPRTGSISQLSKRCAISSRPRGCLKEFRLSRFIFRDLADNNKLSGVKRATW